MEWLPSSVLFRRSAKWKCRQKSRLEAIQMPLRQIWAEQMTKLNFCQKLSEHILPKRITKVQNKKKNNKNKIKLIAWTCNKIRQPETASNVNVSTRPSILVLPQTQKIAGTKISGNDRRFDREKIVYTTKFSGFNVPTLNSGFKISGDMTKPGCFYFGFVVLVVNGKTNPVVKRSGFVTNPEQFPLV